MEFCFVLVLNLSLNKSDPNPLFIEEVFRFGSDLVIR